MLQLAVRTATSVALLSIVALSAPQAAPQPATKSELSARDVQELGAHINKWVNVDQKELKKKEQAFNEIRKFLEKAGKTRNSKDPLQGGLSLTADLSRALFLSAEYRMDGVKPGAVSVRQLGKKDDPRGSYAVWLPKTYKANLEPYPLLIVFPGMKDGKVLGGEAFLQDNWLEPVVREKAVIAVLDLPEDPKSWTEPTTADGKPGGVAIAMMSLADLRARYAIDFDRIYVCGREAGVAAAVSLGGKYMQNFAGVIGRSGDAGGQSPANFSNLPTYFAGAGAEAAAFQEACKTAGHDNCTIKSDGVDADMMQWIAEHPRVSNPTKVVLYPGRPIPTRAYWLKVPATDVDPKTQQDAKIEAEIDRAKNTITIASSAVRQVTLMLNDELLDLDKPVKLVLNGAAQEAVFQRSLEDTLDMMYTASSEPGRVYVVRKDFDLPAAPAK